MPTTKPTKHQVTKKEVMEDIGLQVTRYYNELVLLIYKTKHIDGEDLSDGEVLDMIYDKAKEQQELLEKSTKNYKNF